MSHIIAARFDTFDAATAAATRLFADGIRENDIQVFFVNPGGQHDAYLLGGDRAVDPDSAGGGGGAVKGGILGACVLAALGWLLMLVLGWHWGIVALLALVGAYIGFLQGAVFKLGDRDTRLPAHMRLSGVMLAVRMAGYDRSAIIIELEQAGGDCMEEAMGRWRGGKWVSFDPLSDPHEITSGATERQSQQ